MRCTVVGRKAALKPPLGIACCVINTTLTDEDRVSLVDVFARASPLAFGVLVLLIIFPSLSLVLV